MDTWYVDYFSLQQRRQMQSRRMDTRELAISLAVDLERHQACHIYSIVGPVGEMPWEQVRPKAEKV